ncbi:hypothetical protein ACJX0J_011040, partial [Zea mays]
GMEFFLLMFFCFLFVVFASFIDMEFIIQTDGMLLREAMYKFCLCWCLHRFSEVIHGLSITAASLFLEYISCHVVFLLTFDIIQNVRPMEQIVDENSCPPEQQHYCFYIDFMNKIYIKSLCTCYEMLTLNKFYINFVCNMFLF